MAIFGDRIFTIDMKVGKSTDCSNGSSVEVRTLSCDAPNLFASKSNRMGPIGDRVNSGI